MQGHPLQATVHIWYVNNTISFIYFYIVTFYTGFIYVHIIGCRWGGTVVLQEVSLHIRNSIYPELNPLEEGKESIERRKEDGKARNRT